MLKKAKKIVTIGLSLRLTPEEMALIREKAVLYAKGNVSFWIRYAATSLEPKAKDLAKDDDEEK